MGIPGVCEHLHSFPVCTSLQLRPLTFIAGMSTVTSFPGANDFRGTLKGVAEEAEFQSLFLEL